jgi:hypothetical protein
MGRIKKGLVVVASVAAVSAAASALGVPAAAAGQQSAAQNAAVAGRARVARVSGPAASALAGYMWSTSLTGGPSSAYYAFDTAGGPIGSITGAPGGGQYAVYFPGLGAASANPTIDITRYGTPGTCSLLNVQTTGALVVSVGCYSPTGVPEDALFDIAVAQPVPAPQGVLDYDAVTQLGPQLGPGQYNSSHKTNSVKRLGIGRFQVTMPGPGTTGTTGTVKVSDVNITTGNCEIAGWHGTSTGQVIDVDCFSVTGTPMDQAFLITYARGTNLMGLNGVTTADAFANRPTAATEYQPSTQYDSHRNARVTAMRLAQGTYQVIFGGSEGPGNLNGGHVQVSAVGHTDDLCYVVSWTQQQLPTAHVACVNNLGAPADSAFTIQWVVA